MLDEIVRAPLEQQGNKRRHLVSFLLLGRILIAGETGNNKKEKGDCPKKIAVHGKYPSKGII